MDAAESKNSQGIGLPKAANNLFDEMFQRTKLDNDKDEPFKSRDLHFAKTDNAHITEIKNIILLEESELSSSRNLVKQLALQIEESKAKAKAMKSALQASTKTEINVEESHYLKLVQELEKSKQELSRLKLAVASATKSKSEAEKEFEAWSSKVEYYRHTAEELQNQIEEVDEEHVLVELARIEAEKEIPEIEAQRRSEADKFLRSMKVTRNIIEKLRRETEYAKELEAILTAANIDVDVLQHQLKLVRAMEKNELDTSKQNSESAEAELRAAKQELSSLKEEGFQLMSSMDQARNELIRVAEETCHFKKLEKKVESKIQNLDSKISIAKTKLEDALVADERSKAIISNLTTALEQLKMERDAAKREEELMAEKTRNIVVEIKETHSQITCTEKKLRDCAQELLTVKVSEAKTLNKLKRIAERIMQFRASTVLHKTSITISKREYTYLSQRALAAKDVANKKVAAARAWMAALAAEEKEINMKTELHKNEIRRLEAEDTREIDQMQNLSAEEFLFTIISDTEEDDNANLQLVPAKPRRSNSRLSSSSGTRYPRSPSIAIKKRTKVMPNLMKFLSKQRNRKN